MCSISCVFFFLTKQKPSDLVACRQALVNGFFGPAKKGVYSPAVQYTVYDMGNQVLDAVPEVSKQCMLCLWRGSNACSDGLV